MLADIQHNGKDDITAYRDELSALMTERFQFFTLVQDKSVSDHYSISTAISIGTSSKLQVLFLSIVILPEL